jgi:hypothetical protein
LPLPDASLSHEQQQLISASLERVNRTVAEGMAALQRQQSQWMVHSGLELNANALYHDLGSLSPASFSPRRTMHRRPSADPPGSDCSVLPDSTQSCSLPREPRDVSVEETVLIIARPDPPEEDPPSSPCLVTPALEPLREEEEETTIASKHGTDRSPSPFLWQIAYLAERRRMDQRSEEFLRLEQTCPLPALERRWSRDAPGAGSSPPCLRRVTSDPPSLMTVYVHEEEGLSPTTIRPDPPRTTPWPERTRSSSETIIDSEAITTSISPLVGYNVNPDSDSQSVNSVATTERNSQSHSFEGPEDNPAWDPAPLEVDEPTSSAESDSSGRAGSTDSGGNGHHLSMAHKSADRPTNQDPDKNRRFGISASVSNLCLNHASNQPSSQSTPPALTRQVETEVQRPGAFSVAGLSDEEGSDNNSASSEAADTQDRTSGIPTVCAELVDEAAEDVIGHIRQMRAALNQVVEYQQNQAGDRRQKHGRWNSWRLKLSQFLPQFLCLGRRRLSEPLGE